MDNLEKFNLGSTRGESIRLQMAVTEWMRKACGTLLNVMDGTRKS
jgi:hypothetical protein